MGYRDFAKDYEIEYVERAGRNRPKMKRIYIGPLFQFSLPAQRIRWLRWFYLINMLLLAVFQLIPMFVDCSFSRTWYIEVPAVTAWIPWLLAVGATWRLWTANGTVNREHYELMHDRMSGASLFLMGFHSISAIGCIMLLFETYPTLSDGIVCACCIACVFFSTCLFSRRKELEMTCIENPEKSHKNK